MTIREIKKDAKFITKTTVKNPIFAFWYLYFSPAIVTMACLMILTVAVENGGILVNLGFLFPLVMGYFSLWYGKYIINSIGGNSNIPKSRPTSHHFWEYFPYIGLISVLLLLNLFLPNSYLWVFDLISLILQILFLPICYTIVILNREGAGKIGLKLGSKYFLRTLALQIRFIPLFILIGITFGILSFWKYSYIETTYCLYTLDLLKKENIK